MPHIMATKLKLYSKEDVRQAIRRRGNEIAAKMSDEELYRSSEFSDYATHLADFILRKHKLYSLQIEYIQDPSAPIAYTDGKKIFWNTGNVIAAFPSLLERRFKANMGILMHECAHKLFLDFSIRNKALSQIESGKLYGKFQTGGDPALDNAKTELDDVVASPYAGSLAEIYAHLCNILDDGHDEMAMKRCFPGFIADCIKTAGEVQMETADSLSDAIANRRSTYSISCSLLLEYSKFGYYKIGQDSPQTDEHINRVSVLEPIVDAALQCDALKDRWNHLNLIVLHLWPCIREMFPKDLNNSQNSSQGSPGGSQSSQGGGGSQTQGQSSSGANGGQQPQQPTPQSVSAAISQAMKEVEKATNSAPAPKNGTGKAVDPNQIQTGGVDPGAGSTAQSLAQQAAQAKAVASVQSELDDAQMEAIRNSNVPLIHKRANLHTVRHNPQNKAKYEKISAEVAPLVRNLVKEMLALMQELNEEAICHHKRFGPIVEATEAYRPDNAFFAKKKLPEDLPNMALCILVDESPSMYGKKIDCAVRTTIMLERFATEIGIPVMIAGHNVSSGVNLRIYTDFVSAMTTEDRYSLAGISASGRCNRDGLPIHICCDLLAQRQEQVRLMVVISDGAPNDTGYKGQAARDDISKIVNSFRRKGLLIYGAAIDKDRSVIESIYGNGFLSIQNLSALPKTLVRLIRQQII